MASNYTENFSLCQWEATDQVLRTEFNEDNTKIDAALKQQANDIAKEITDRKAAVTATASTVPKIAVGSYTGDSAASRSISVGFTPRAVYVCSEEGLAYSQNSSGYSFGGLAISGKPAQHSGNIAVQIIANGFTVYQKTVSSYSAIQCNMSGMTYHYLAIG